MTSSQRTKRDVIVEALRNQILSGELPRGTRMPQDELARRFEASITPVREALRLLEAEGLLVSSPHRGVRVAGVDLEGVKATYVMRRLVESYAMRRAATRLSRRDLAQAKNLVVKMEADLQSGDYAAFRERNRQFHFLFYERCGMPSLTEQIEKLWQAFPWDLSLNVPVRLKRSHAEHKQMLEALELGDVEAVSDACETHIAEGFRAIAARLGADSGSQGDPFSLDAD